MREHARTSHESTLRQLGRQLQIRRLRSTVSETILKFHIDVRVLKKGGKHARTPNVQHPRAAVLLHHCQRASLPREHFLSHRKRHRRHPHTRGFTLYLAWRGAWRKLILRSTVSYRRPAIILVTTPSDVHIALRQEPRLLVPILGDPELLNRVYREHGVKVTVELQQIHSPAPEARRADGKGKTLCGRSGVRGAEVTCQHCLRRLEKGGAR